MRGWAFRIVLLMSLLLSGVALASPVNAAPVNCAAKHVAVSAGLPTGEAFWVQGSCAKGKHV